MRNLSVADHTGQMKVKDFSIDVHKGEIVIAGVDGNGQSELLYGLCGLYR